MLPCLVLRHVFFAEGLVAVFALFVGRFFFAALVALRQVLDTGLSLDHFEV